MRWIRWISRFVSRSSRNCLQPPLDWTCALQYAFSHGFQIAMHVWQDAKFIDHSWRLIVVGKVVVGVLGCYHVLLRVGFLPRIHWYCHCFLYYFLRILLGQFPRPIPSLRKLFNTLPCKKPQRLWYDRRVLIHDKERSKMC